MIKPNRRNVGWNVVHIFLHMYNFILCISLHVTDSVTMRGYVRDER